MPAMGGIKAEMNEHAELGVMPPLHAALLVGGRRAAGGIAARPAAVPAAGAARTAGAAAAAIIKPRRSREKSGMIPSQRAGLHAHAD